MDDAHIYRAADRPALLDVFCMAGPDLYRAILDDIVEVHAGPARADALRADRRSPTSATARGLPELDSSGRR